MTRAEGVHVPGPRPGICGRVVEAGVEEEVIFIQPPIDEHLSVRTQRLRLATDGRGHTKALRPRPSCPGWIVELGGVTLKIRASEDQHVAVGEQRRREALSEDVHAGSQVPMADRKSV